MSLDFLTAIVIFCSPDDLLITVERKTDEKFFIAIFGGPSRNFKLLLSTDSFAETREEAIQGVKGILEDAYQRVVDSSSNVKKRPSRGRNTEVLSPDWITRIVEELQRRQFATTYTMLTPAV